MKRKNKSSFELLNESSNEFENDEENDLLFALKEEEMKKSYWEDKRKFIESKKRNFSFSPASQVFAVIQKQMGLTPSNIYEDPNVKYKDWFNSSKKPIKETKYKILNIPARSVIKNGDSLFYKVFSILKRRKSPQHINDILDCLKKYGQLESESQHLYSIIYRTITRNKAFFLKTGKATFTLRKGFSKLRKTESLNKDNTDINELESFNQLVVMAAKELKDKESINPSTVFQYLKKFGYNGNYKSIYRSMQSPFFIKNGFNYELVDNV